MIRAVEWSPADPVIRQADGSDNWPITWSEDYARTWRWSDWKFETRFGVAPFLNFGKNYAGARDDYVYVDSNDHDSAYEAGDRMVMARVPKDRIREQDAYEFFRGLDGHGWVTVKHRSGRIH